MGSAFPRHVHAGAHDWGQVLMFQGKTCSHFRSFTKYFRSIIQPNYQLTALMLPCSEKGIQHIRRAGDSMWYLRSRRPSTASSCLACRRELSISHQHVICIWLNALHQEQRQTQVSHFVEYPMQRCLVCEWTEEYGFVIVSLDDGQPIEPCGPAAIKLSLDDDAVDFLLQRLILSLETLFLLLQMSVERASICLPQAKFLFSSRLRRRRCRRAG
jgi:hypothetical protein